MKTSLRLSHSPGIRVYGYPLPAGKVPLWRQAMAWIHKGDHAAALRCMLALSAEQSDFLPARVQAAYLLLGTDCYRDALALARELSDCVPRSAEFALQLIKLLRCFEEHERIALLFGRVDWNACMSVDVLGRVAGELGPIGLYCQAAMLLGQADRLGQDNHTVQILRGTLAFIEGDVAGARQSLRTALERAGPDMPHARWMLTLQPEPECIGRDIDTLSDRLRSVRPGTEDEAYLAFGLHNLFHAASLYEESWRALERGCRVKHNLERYERRRQHALMDALASMPERAVCGAAGDEAPKVIFIVGMHRSGTSVLERVLGGHPSVADGGESYVFTAAMREATDHYCRGVIDDMVVARASASDLALVGKRFRDYARWRAGGRACFTEKLPSNFLNLGFVLSSMPDACVLHMRRNPMDTCFSNLRTFFSGGAAPYSYDQLELADYFRMYRGLMHHWHQRFPGRILDIDYEAFVEDPEAQTARVMSFCGLDFRPEALDISRSGGYSATASIASLRHGILKNRGGVWRSYRAHLDPLLRALDGADPARDWSI